MYAAVFLILAFVSVTVGNPLVNGHSDPEHHLLGSKRCTWGPTYWCGNIRTAKECGATKHCIQAVWEHTSVPEDNDDICQICKEMVKEARDQLLSNETQEELKEVFEGSCKLIPLKVISKECIKLVDEFIPELVETLASQMNPTMVCTVAGLCNSARIDKLLGEHKKTSKEPVATVSNDCAECHKFADDMIAILKTLSKDEVLQKLLGVCGHLDSFSTSCKVIVEDNLNLIYDLLTKSLNSKNLCDLLGMCNKELSFKPSVPITAISGIKVRGTRILDLPCAFCKKLVIRLRDMLVSETTKEEFKMVLEGICKHLRSYEDECLEFVSEYYSMVYDFLVNDLVPVEICRMVGLCEGIIVSNLVATKEVLAAETVQKAVNIVPAEAIQKAVKLVPVETMQKAMKLVPAEAIQKAVKLVPAETVQKAVKLVPAEAIQKAVKMIPEETVQKAVKLVPAEQVVKALPLIPAVPLNEIKTANQGLPEQEEQVDQSKLHHVQLKQEDLGVKMSPVIPVQQLPIVRMMPQAVLQGNRVTCVVCEYVFHYLQNILMNQTDQKAIKEAIEKVCTLMPEPVQDKCVNFIDQYGEAVMVILAQDIDPSQMCPLLHLCPDNTGKKERPGCVICEYVIQDLYDILKDKRNEDAIREGLEKVCGYLPTNLAEQCKDFIDVYSNDIIYMIIADFTPEEVCTTIKLCTPEKGKKKEIVSNEIPQKKPEKAQPAPSQLMLGENEGETETLSPHPLCTLCQLVIREIQHELKKNASEEEIEKFIERVCSFLSSEVAKECDQFIAKYHDKIIQLLDLMDHMEPQAICAMLVLCEAETKQVAGPVKFEKCDMCEVVVKYVDKLLQDASFQQTADQVLEKVCKYVPGDYRDQCKELIELYGPYIISMLGQLADSKKVCQAMGMCPSVKGQVHLLGGEKCTWGPTYWCQTEFHAKACQALSHCRENVWKADLPRRN